MATLTIIPAASTSISTACLRNPGLRHSAAAPATRAMADSIRIESTAFTVGLPSSTPAITDSTYAANPRGMIEEAISPRTTHTQDKANHPLHLPPAHGQDSGEVYR